VISFQRALKSLAGLSVGDTFGEQFFFHPPDFIARREVPPGPWRWTDDTHMALSIVETLLKDGTIEQDTLALQFARRYVQQLWRGYAGGAKHLLKLYSQGADWRKESPELFDGGSFGNGSAMRAAPIGAFFAGEPERAASPGI
jgi:ADP-ribosylglycohydrolase